MNTWLNMAEWVLWMARWKSFWTQEKTFLNEQIYSPVQKTFNALVIPLTEKYDTFSTCDSKNKQFLKDNWTKIYLQNKVLKGHLHHTYKFLPNQIKIISFN